MKVVYLDNAATSFPKPLRVYSEVERCLREYCANPGRSGHNMAMKCAALIYETRECLAHFFNIENPLRICFTKNATEALNIAIKGLLTKGSHCVTTSLEHNSVLRPLQALQDEGTAEYSIVHTDSSGILDPQKFARAIKGNTRLAVCTLSSNVNGVILPFTEITKICKEKGIAFLLDASQGAGSVEIDVKKHNIDLLAFPGHKGLLGLQGTGGLYVNDAITLRCLIQGGTGSRSLELQQPSAMPDNIESGTLNTPGIVGLQYGVKFIENMGIKKLSAYKNNLVSFFHEELHKIPNVKIYSSRENNSGIVAINIADKDSISVSDILDKKFGIASRASFHCAPLAHRSFGTLKQGIVRLSVGCFNTVDEIEYAVKAIFEISKLI